MRAWKRFSVTLLVGCSPVQVAKKFYPGGWVGEDREGSPVFYDPIGKADFRGLLHSMKRSDILKLQLHGGEVALRKCQEQSKKLGQLISTIVLVFDMEGFSIRNHLWKPVIGVMMEVQYTVHVQHLPNAYSTSYYVYFFADSPLLCLRQTIQNC
eukprot:m.84502 g.84502  ORF g.84502 m.84502 type:complete len:154 (+) comp36410_c0_seq17:295-756(+)